MKKISKKSILCAENGTKIFVLLGLIFILSCQAAKEKKKNEQEQKLALAIQHFEKEEYEQSIQILEVMRVDNEKVSEYLAQSLLARNGIDTFDMVKAVYAIEEKASESDVNIISDIMSLWPEINERTKADLEKAKDLFENLIPFSIAQNRANLSELFFYKSIYIVYLAKETFLDLEKLKKTNELPDTVVQAYQVFQKDNLTLIESELYELINLVEYLPPKSEKIISRYLDKVKPFWDYKKTIISINIRDLGEKFLQDILRKMIDAEFEAHKQKVEKYLGYTKLSPEEFKENVLEIIGGKQKPSDFVRKVLKEGESKLEEELKEGYKGEYEEEFKEELKDKLDHGYQEDLLRHFFETAGK